MINKSYQIAKFYFVIRSEIGSGIGECFKLEMLRKYCQQSVASVSVIGENNTWESTATSIGFGIILFRLSLLWTKRATGSSADVIHKHRQSFWETAFSW